MTCLPSRLPSCITTIPARVLACFRGNNQIHAAPLVKTWGELVPLEGYLLYIDQLAPLSPPATPLFTAFFDRYRQTDQTFAIHKADIVPFFRENSATLSAAYQRLERDIDLNTPTSHGSRECMILFSLCLPAVLDISMPEFRSAIGIPEIIPDRVPRSSATPSLGTTPSVTPPSTTPRYLHTSAM